MLRTCENAVVNALLAYMDHRRETCSTPAWCSLMPHHLSSRSGEMRLKPRGLGLPVLPMRLPVVMVPCMHSTGCPPSSRGCCKLRVCKQRPAKLVHGPTNLHCEALQ